VKHEWKFEESFINQGQALFGISVNYSRSLGFHKVCVTPPKKAFDTGHTNQQQGIILHRFCILLVLLHKSL